MVAAPGVQPAGQTSPCSATNWNARTRRSASSTSRPTASLVRQAAASLNQTLQRTREVVDRDLLQRAGGVDDEEAAERDASVFKQRAVGRRNLLRHVCQQRNLHVAEPAALARSTHPRQVALGRVCTWR